MREHSLLDSSLQYVLLVATVAPGLSVEYQMILNVLLKRVAVVRLNWKTEQETKLWNEGLRNDDRAGCLKA